MGLRRSVLLLVGVVAVSGCSESEKPVVIDKVVGINTDPLPVTIHVGGDDDHACSISITTKGMDKTMRDGGYTVTHGGDPDMSVSCEWDGHHVLSVRPEHKTAATVVIYADRAGTRQIWLDGSFVQVLSNAEVASRLNVSTPNPITLLKAGN